MCLLNMQKDCECELPNIYYMSKFTKTFCWNNFFTQMRKTNKQDPSYVTEPIIRIRDLVTILNHLLRASKIFTLRITIPVETSKSDASIKKPLQNHKIHNIFFA